MLQPIFYPMMVHFIGIVRRSISCASPTHPPPGIYIPPPVDGNADDALKKIEMSHSLVAPQLDLCSVTIE